MGKTHRVLYYVGTYTCTYERPHHSAYASAHMHIDYEGTYQSTHEGAD